MKEVGAYLGNTPGVAKASYVDPRAVGLFHGGRTIEPALLEIGDAALRTSPQEPRAQFSSCSPGGPTEPQESFPADHRTSQGAIGGATRRPLSRRTRRCPVPVPRVS